MALSELNRILAAAADTWPEVHLAVVHRTGHLAVGEVAVAIVAAAPHRREAFAAGGFVIDEIKRSVPIWKKESTPNGSFWKGG